LLAAAIAAACSGPPPAQDSSVVVYAVRHAERADDGLPSDAMMGDDPPLSAAGLERAVALADLLAHAGLTHVHTTDYQRTRQTAGPVSDATGIALDLYDPADVAALARRLLATPGTHLVVGHSDTTPELVEALGGEPGEPIAALEYDRIYVVRIAPDGTTGSVLFRFGSS
jgi:broad specificity phosphatase PhoE